MAINWNRYCCQDKKKMLRGLQLSRIDCVQNNELVFVNLLHPGAGTINSFIISSLIAGGSLGGGGHTSDSIISSVTRIIPTRSGGSVRDDLKIIHNGHHWKQIHTFFFFVSLCCSTSWTCTHVCSLKCWRKREIKENLIGSNYLIIMHRANSSCKTLSMYIISKSDTIAPLITIISSPLMMPIKRRRRNKNITKILKNTRVDKHKWPIDKYVFV